MRDLLYLITDFFADIADMSLFYLMLSPIDQIHLTKRATLISIILMAQGIMIGEHILGLGMMLLGSIVIIFWILWGGFIAKREQVKLILHQIILATGIVVISNGLLICIPILFCNANFQMICSPGLVRIICLAISKGVSLILVYFITKRLKQNVLQEFSFYFHYLIVLFLLFIVSYCYLLEGAMKTESLGHGVETNALFTMLWISMFMLIMILFLIKIVKRSQTVFDIREQNQIQQQVLARQKKEIRHIRIKQHEYKNNMESIHALLLERDIEKARSFMNEMMSQTNEIDKRIRRNTSFIEIMINYKLQEAANKQIRISKSIEICAEIPIEDCDVAIVINNAINNAIEACERLPEPMRYIRCKVHMRLGYLNFYFENPCEARLTYKDGCLVTTKKNQVEHGIGIQNIRSVIERYNGLLDYNCENTIFCLKCSLLIPKDKSA